MKIQSIASEADLHKSGDLSMEYTNTTGHPVIQSFGGEAPQSNTPVDQVPTAPGAGIPMKQFQGSQAPLTRTASRGWESRETPMSDRSWEQGR